MSVGSAHVGTVLAAKNKLKGKVARMKISDYVYATHKRVTIALGETFSFKALKWFTEAKRHHKSLRFEEVTGPLAVTGYVKPLKDMDLIVTRAGMDEGLTRMTRLHEIAHLLLEHVNEYPTETYDQWVQNGRKHDSSIQREALDNKKDLEIEAEALATLLLGCIIRKEVMPPDLAKDVYGWES